MRPAQQLQLAAFAFLVGETASAQGSSPFTSARLAARSDSFAFVVQGTPRGFLKETIEKTANGFRLVSVQELMGGMMTQSTEVTFSPTLEMQRVSQSGKARGQDMKIDVTYADGRAKGTATTPAPDGQMHSVVVDAALPKGAVDDNVLMSLIPLLPLAEGATWKVPVFASGKGEAKEMTITVGAKQNVATLVGSYDAWPVVVSDGPVPVTFYIAAGEAPRVVKMTMAGSPLTLERASK